METIKHCSKCSSGNSSTRKFCNSCGSPLGPICDRCGMVNNFEDQFCGTCGMPFSSSIQRTTMSAPMSGQESLTNSKQYSAEDINELLTLRRAAKNEENDMIIIGQDDIDKLFE